MTTPFDMVIEATHDRLARHGKPKPYFDIHLGIDLDRLAMTDDQVARLPRPEREARLTELLTEANLILDRAIAVHIPDNLVLAPRYRRELVGIVPLFSGGNDSTVLMHLLRHRATAAGHANTRVGIEQTREFVRATCERWGLPLLERSAPREEDSYWTHVDRYGFPGPGAHGKIYQRIKERAFRQIRRELVPHPTRQRIVFVAGRRRTESDRRANVPAAERDAAVVWVSPLINWTKLDMNTYRLMMAAAGDPVPVNIVAELCEMSGECLCGCMAHYNEKPEFSEWYPDAFDEINEHEAIWASRPEDFIHPVVIAEYEAKVAAGKRPRPPKPVPMYVRTWGWAGDPRLLALSNEKPTSGRLCGSCHTRWEQSALAITDEENAA